MNLPASDHLLQHPGQPVRCPRRSALTLLPPSLVSPHWQSQLPHQRASVRRARSGGEPKLVLYAKVIAWAAKLPEFPAAEQVEDEFNVHKATANRWLNAIAEAYSVERPRRTTGGRRRNAVE